MRVAASLRDLQMAVTDLRADLATVRTVDECLRLHLELERVLVDLDELATAILEQAGALCGSVEGWQ